MQFYINYSTLIKVKFWSKFNVNCCYVTIIYGSRHMKGYNRIQNTCANYSLYCVNILSFIVLSRENIRYAKFLLGPNGIRRLDWTAVVSCVTMLQVMMKVGYKMISWKNKTADHMQFYRDI